MPIYNFKCKCGHVTEELLDWGVTEYPCAKCGKPARKTIGKPNLVFKGKAWADKERKL
jgi:putative FmdB family regulatory protein